MVSGDTNHGDTNHSYKVNYVTQLNTINSLGSCLHESKSDKINFKSRRILNETMVRGDTKHGDTNHDDKVNYVT